MMVIVTTGGDGALVKLMVMVILVTPESVLMSVTQVDVMRVVAILGYAYRTGLESCIRTFRCCDLTLFFNFITL